MSDKIYFVTGASSDVGLAYLKSLEEKLAGEQKKACVVAHYASGREELEKLGASMKAVDLHLLQADLTDQTSLAEMLEKLTTDYGVPDHILHLPAAKLVYQKMKQFDWEMVDRDMQIQVRSLAEIGKTLLPKMAKRGSGKVAVMLSSCVVGMPSKFMSQYTVVKYALLGLMNSMAVEYAEKGITVNGISPNMMETKFLENIDERIVELNREKSILKRNVSVEEVIPAIHFLLSEETSYINGVNIKLTGGER